MSQSYNILKNVLKSISKKLILDLVLLVTAMSWLEPMVLSFHPLYQW